MSSGRRSNYHRYRQSQSYGRRFPDRWEMYDSVGRDIEGTPFVPFKTPLDDSFFTGKKYPEDLQFGVKSFLNMASRANKTIGLVVDLTNTDRYYKKSEWTDNNVEYVKLNCPGHEVNEREDLVLKFISIVKTFLDKSENDGKLVGVHCTHGLNRTGYLICRYLIDELGYSAADAISLFEYYRGHPIERSQYKKSLYEAELSKKNIKPQTVGLESGDQLILKDDINHKNENEQVTIESHVVTANSQTPQTNNDETQLRQRNGEQDLNSGESGDHRRERLIDEPPVNTDETQSSIEEPI